MNKYGKWIFILWVRTHLRTRIRRKLRMFVKFGMHFVRIDSRIQQAGAARTVEVAGAFRHLEAPDGISGPLRKLFES